MVGISPDVMIHWLNIDPREGYNEERRWTRKIGNSKERDQQASVSRAYLRDLIS